jgi:tetratricopeptide (TPR) repeat protein
MTMSARLEQLMKLHGLDAADPFLTYGIALEHSKVGAHGEAVKWLDKTLSLDVNYFYAYFQKGKALSALGEEDQARAVLEAGMAAAKAKGDMHAFGEMQGLLENL